MFDRWRHRLEVFAVAAMLSTIWFAWSEVSTAAKSAPLPGDLPRLVLVLRGDVDVTLTDPRGRVNAMRDTGEYNAIPGCQRLNEWTEPGSKAPPEVPVTAFDVSGAAPGLFGLRVRALKAGTVWLTATATPLKGPECTASDTLQQRIGERRTFSVFFESLGDSGCRLQAGHRRGFLANKKKTKE